MARGAPTACGPQHPRGRVKSGLEPGALPQPPGEGGSGSRGPCGERRKRVLPRTWAWLPGRPGTSPLATTPLSPSCCRLGGLNPPGGRGLSHTQQAGGAGRIGGPGMAPVPQSHPDASPSIPSLHPLRPQPPSSALCNFCWCQDTALLWTFPAPPHPCPHPHSLPFTLTLLLYCTPRVKNHHVWGLTQEVTPPAPPQIPYMYVLGRAPLRAFQGFLSPQSPRSPGKSQYLQRIPSPWPSPTTSTSPQSPATAILRHPLLGAGLEPLFRTAAR